MFDRKTREQQRKKFQELITGNTGNETRYKRLKDNNDSTIVSSGSGSGRGKDNNDNFTIVSSGSGNDRGKDNNDNSTIVRSGSGSNDNNVEVIRQTLEVSNNNLGIINSGSRDNKDNPIIIGRERVRGRGRNANDDEDSSIISGRGRGKLSNENNNNNFGNHFEGIRKYIEVIIFRFIIKNFLFITVY